jgi:phosphohistidine phosphatase
VALYLVQHGKSLPKNVDPEKGLSEEGIEEVRKIADVARNYGIAIQEIHHSGKKRTRQTAMIMSAALPGEPRIAVVDGINPLDDPISFSRRLHTRNNRMLVGHLPFLQRLVSLLITDSIDILVFKFQNAGIVCLDKDDGAPNWHIKWTLMPNIN